MDVPDSINQGFGLLRSRGTDELDGKGKGGEGGGKKRQMGMGIPKSRQGGQSDTGGEKICQKLIPELQETSGTLGEKKVVKK